jgi:transcriptional regulator with XRE-family HTH domain
MDWAIELKKIRESTGLSQQKMAELIGIPQKTWSNYESGRSSPKMAFFLSLEAKGFSVSGLFPNPIQDAIDAGKISEEEIRFKQNPENIKKLGLPDDTDIDIVAKAMDKLWRDHKNLPEKQAEYKIPLLRQKVSCGPGENWESEGNIAEYLDVHTLIPRLGIGRVFAMKAHGSSMLGAGIRGGDYLLFSASDEIAFNDGIYVFVLDGDVYCKRLEFDKLVRKIKIFSVRVSDLEKAELVTTIDTSDTSFADRFRIFGRVTQCIHLIEEEE